MFKTAFAVFVFIALSIASRAQLSQALNRTLSITFENRPLTGVFADLQSKTNIRFAFDPSIVPAGQRVSATFTDTRVLDILDKLLDGTSLTFSLVADQVVIQKRTVRYCTINGYVTEARSGESLIEANISIPELDVSTATNQYGFFSLTIPAGLQHLVISHVEYWSERKSINVDADKHLSFSLRYKENSLAEVVVGTVQKPDSSAINYGIRNLRNEQLNKLPYYAGEVDVIKALQTQNGVKALTEGSSAMFIRGGNIDHNLIILDEALVYNPSHLFGLVSVFNPDAIKNVQLYKDFMPATFGGRLSSVLDARMADGNNKKYHVKGGVSLLSFRAAAEGPIVKEKSSFLFTFRRSLIDLLNKDYRLLNPNSAYYDVNFKANYHLSRNNKIFYSFYNGEDHLYSNNSFSNKWGNITSTFRWNHLFSSRLFLNLSAIYSNYENSLDLNSDTLSEKEIWQTGIRDKSLKADFTYFIKPGNELRFGSIFTRHAITPGKIKGSLSQEPNIPENTGSEYALYASHKYPLGNRVELVYGLRLAGFKNSEEVFGVYDGNENLVGAKSTVHYLHLEPRLNVTFGLNSGQAVHLTYNRNVQYLQLISKNELAFSSLESWMPASEDTRPQIADHFSAGYSFQERDYVFSASPYYKRFGNQVELLDHTQLIQNPEIRSFLRYGKSEAYGLELGFSKSTGRLRTETGYTWSRVFKRIDDLNSGEWFRANYDVPHEFKSNTFFAIDDRLRLNMFFILASGRPATQAVGYFVHDGVQVPVYERRNNARFPVFNRLDISIQYVIAQETASERVMRHNFSAGIYNVYNRKNPLYYRLAQPTGNRGLGVVNSSTGILPWVAYSFQF